MNKDMGIHLWKKNYIVMISRFIFIVFIFNSIYGRALGESIFPSLSKSFGSILPSVSFAIDRKEDASEVNENELIMYYYDFSEEDYKLLDRYFAAAGCVSESINIDRELQTIQINVSVNDESIVLDYECSNEKLAVHYPENMRFEGVKGTYKESEGLFPDIESVFFAEIPDIRNVLKRKPQSTLSEKGYFAEVFSGFTEKEYNKVSEYLNEIGCGLHGYTVDEDVVTISLEYFGSIFELVYDTDALIAEFRYPENAYYIPTPTPIPAPTPTPEIKLYSKEVCWEAARRYFERLSWRNPDSIRINSYSGYLSDNSYVFTIDYSAQNGFGGYNRETYYIVVDARSCTVTSAVGL